MAQQGEVLIGFAHYRAMPSPLRCENEGVKTALVTTRGFRDVLEIGRGNRPDLYKLRTPSPYIPRRFRF